MGTRRKTFSSGGIRALAFRAVKRPSIISSGEIADAEVSLAKRGAWNKIANRLGNKSQKEVVRVALQRTLKKYQIKSAEDQKSINIALANLLKTNPADANAIKHAMASLRYEAMHRLGDSERGIGFVNHLLSAVNDANREVESSLFAHDTWTAAKKARKGKQT